MKLPSKQSRGGGIPVNVPLKRLLRNRSMLLTNTQRQVCKQMGIITTKTTTEKQAAAMAKRVCGPETNYAKDPTCSLLFKKRNSAKPKKISARQAKMEVLMHRSENGSNRAAKLLANL